VNRSRQGDVQQLIDSGTKSIDRLAGDQGLRAAAQRAKVGDAHCLIGLGQLGSATAESQAGIPRSPCKPAPITWRRKSPWPGSAP